MIETLLLSVTMAVAAGLVGCFAVMRRMALAADALSHVALPGIGVALALHIHPIFGATAMLFFGALVVWAVDGRARVGTEAVIGVLFSAALAVGSMMTSGQDLVDALFGGSGILNLAGNPVRHCCRDACGCLCCYPKEQSGGHACVARRCAHGRHQRPAP